MRPRSSAVVRPALIVLGVLVLLAIAPPASAHTELLTVDPAAGAVLDGVPATVTFTYSSPVEADFAEAAVTPPGGAAVRIGADRLSVAGSTVSVPIAGDAASAPVGDWVVVLRVVAADGHPVESRVQFTAGGADEPTAPAAAGTDTAKAIGTATGTATPLVPATAATAAAAALTAATTMEASPRPDPDLVSGWSRGTTAALIIGALAVVGGAGAFGWARRR